MLACGRAGAAVATEVEAGCGAGLAACRSGALLEQPISGTDKKLAAVKPNPCCKNLLRDAIVHPSKTICLL
jgi:hypothetical protein